MARKKASETKKVSKPDKTAQEAEQAAQVRDIVLRCYIADKGNDVSAWGKTPGWSEINQFSRDVWLRVMRAMLAAGWRAPL